MGTGPKILHLAVRGFSDDDLASLRSALTMIRPWLKADWRLIHGGRADVVLVMGRSEAVHEPAALVVSCLSTPGKDARLSLRWPLHAAQLMGLLNDCQQRREQSAARCGGAERYALRIWPMQFVDWPTEWWSVLAALSRRPHSVEEIAMCTALPVEQIGQCLAALDGDVVVTGAGHAAARGCREHRVPSGWRRLAARISRALGVD